VNSQSVNGIGKREGNSKGASELGQQELSKFQDRFRDSNGRNRNFKRCLDHSEDTWNEGLDSVDESSQDAIKFDDELEDDQRTIFKDSRCDGCGDGNENGCDSTSASTDGANVDFDGLQEFDSSVDSFYDSVRRRKGTGNPVHHGHICVDGGFEIRQNRGNCIFIAALSVASVASDNLEGFGVHDEAEGNDEHERRDDSGSNHYALSLVGTELK